MRLSGLRWIEVGVRATPTPLAPTFRRLAHPAQRPAGSELGLLASLSFVMVLVLWMCGRVVRFSLRAGSKAASDRLVLRRWR
jgi:hypothetical protein